MHALFYLLLELKSLYILLNMSFLISLLLEKGYKWPEKYPSGPWCSVFIFIFFLVFFDNILFVMLQHFWDLE